MTTGYKKNGVDIDTLLEPRTTGDPQAPATGYKVNGVDISTMFYPLASGGTAPTSTIGMSVAGDDLNTIFAAIGTVVSSIYSDNYKFGVIGELDPYYNPTGMAGGSASWSISRNAALEAVDLIGNGGAFGQNVFTVLGFTPLVDISEKTVKFHYSLDIPNYNSGGGGSMTLHYFYQGGGSNWVELTVTNGVIQLAEIVLPANISTLSWILGTAGLATPNTNTFRMFDMTIV